MQPENRNNYFGGSANRKLAFILDKRHKLADGGKQFFQVSIPFWRKNFKG
jgi:hypothetical protein